MRVVHSGGPDPLDVALRPSRHKPSRRGIDSHRFEFPWGHHLFSRRSCPPRRRRQGIKAFAPSGGVSAVSEAATEAPARPLSEATRRHIHVTAVIAFNAAVAQGLLRANPATRATAPKRRDAGELHTWPKEELRTFLEATREDRLHALWRLLAMTGMRRGEALGLAWSDVDLSGARVVIQRARVLNGDQVLEHAPKTRAGRRPVPLDAATVAVLKEWKKRQTEERLAWGPAWMDSGYVFTSEDGLPLHPGMATKRFGEAVTRAGVPAIRLHDLRHTSATLALAAGVHPKVVQERLGHATISQTLDTYSHTTPSLHEGAAETLAASVDAGA